MTINGIEALTLQLFVLFMATETGALKKDFSLLRLLRRTTRISLICSNFCWSMQVVVMQFYLQFITVLLFLFQLVMS